MPITFKIDGKVVSVPKGTDLLKAARMNGIKIPSLCYHDAVKPYSVCRVCSVKVVKKGWAKYTAACSMLAEEGIEVFTSTEDVINLRKIMIELQLAKSPEAEPVLKLAQEYSIDAQRFSVPDAQADDCILCGLCVRVCDEVIQASAIGFKSRGHDRSVSTTFDVSSEACIGCAACAHVCPTNYIKYEQTADTRTIWKQTFEMLKCKTCGKAIVTKKEAEYLTKLKEVPIEYYEICDECHRKETADKFKNLAKYL